jgi:hypothetical protein
MDSTGPTSHGQAFKKQYGRTPADYARSAR